MFRKKKLAFLPDGVKNSIASATATAVVKIILQPLDTIKTIQQARPNIKLGPIKAAAEVIKNRGIGGLWSGIGISILGSSPSGAVYFGVYTSVKAHITKYFSPQYKLVAVAISAAIGNTFASVLRAPYEVLKQRIQTGMSSCLVLSNQLISYQTIKSDNLVQSIFRNKSHDVSPPSSPPPESSTFTPFLPPLPLIPLPFRSLDSLSPFSFD